MANGTQTQTPFRAPTEAIAQLPVPGGDNISDGGLPPATIDGAQRDDDGTITDQDVIEEAEKAKGGLAPLLLIGAVGFGLFLAFRK